MWSTPVLINEVWLSENQIVSFLKGLCVFSCDPTVHKAHIYLHAIWLRCMSGFLETRFWTQYIQHTYLNIQHVTLFAPCKFLYDELSLMSSVIDTGFFYFQTQPNFGRDELWHINIVVLTGLCVWTLNLDSPYSSLIIESLAIKGLKC